MKFTLALFLAAALWAGDKPMLTADAFARARSFIHQTARPLDRALFAFHFEKGSAAAVIDELAKFQNADGGFATKLEPDVRWEGSSPMATAIGLGILKEVGAPATDPRVRAAVRYLLATYHDGWIAVPREVNTAPHAPWWNFDEKAGKCVVESPVYPAAAIAAHLRAWPELLPAGFLDRITTAALAPRPLELADISILEKLAAVLPDAELVGRLRKAAAAVMVRDPREWVKYNAQPLMLIDSPRAPLYPGLEKETALHLDYVIAHQEADGGWALNWSWPGPAWEIAKKEWRGALAVERLKALRAFQRME